MQKKLRFRFWLISWSLLLLFLIAVCGGIGIYMYESAVDETLSALRTAAESRVLPDETRGMVALNLDEHGHISDVQWTHLNLSDETLSELVADIEMTGEQSAGELTHDGMQYRYLSILQRGGAWTVIAECSHEMTLAKTLRRNTVLFTLLGMVLLLPVCTLLSKWVSKPIETAWEQQNSFVSDATHELKTPLTVIAANTEAVLANPEASIESQEKWLGSIQGETMRMADLVGDLLFLANIDAGEIHLAPEDIAISDELEGMCMERESGLFEAGKLFDYELTPDLHYYGDRKRIRQMMAALLDNAERFTPAGSAIRMVVNRDRNLRIRIVLSNSGNPISETDLPKIFDRFYRADPSRTRGTGGCGLGLCVARSIAELHGGTIMAVCQNGVNVFTVTLGAACNADSR